MSPRVFSGSLDSRLLHFVAFEITRNVALLVLTQTYSTEASATGGAPSAAMDRTALNISGSARVEVIWR